MLTTLTRLMIYLSNKHLLAHTNAHRYADNFDQANHLFVTIKQTNKASVSDLGSPEEFANMIKPFLGVQSWVGGYNTSKLLMCEQ